MLVTRLQRVNQAQSAFDRLAVARTGILPAGAQLLRDVWPFQLKESKQIVTEGVEGQALPVIRVRGLFQHADEENANTRVYRSPILAEAVGAIQDDIQARAVLGEYDHPSDAKVHLDRISHLITAVWMEGRDVFGEAEILDDQPFGKQLKALLERKVQIGISSRGVGDMEVKESKGRKLHYVQPGFRFITWDVVAEPSVSGAFLQLVEGRQRLMRRELAPNLLSRRSYESMLVREIQRVGLRAPNQQPGR